MEAAGISPRGVLQSPGSAPEGLRDGALRDDEFEWDDGKAKRNFRDHCVTFEVARSAFDDPDSIDREDPDPDEERYSRLCRLGHRVFVVVWTKRGKQVRIISARLANKHEQQACFRKKRDRYGMTAEDWRRVDAMTDEEITAAALADPDNPPLTDEQLAQFRRPALARQVRHKLGMGREAFAAAYGIPLETLWAWERHEAEPTQVEIAYLRLIEREPEMTRMPVAMAAN